MPDVAAFLVRLTARRDSHRGHSQVRIDGVLSAMRIRCQEVNGEQTLKIGYALRNSVDQHAVSRNRPIDVQHQVINTVRTQAGNAELDHEQVRREIGVGRTERMPVVPCENKA